MDDAPFIRLDYFDGLLYETRQVSNSFETFLTAVTTGPTTIQDVIKQLEVIAEKAKSLASTAKDDFKNAGLSAMDTVKGVANLTKNVGKLSKELQKVKTIPPLITEAAKDLKALVPKFKEIFQTCDQVGKQAFSANVLKPKEIFAKYHTGTKKTQAELDTEKKAAEKKMGKRPAPKAAPTSSSAPSGNQPNPAGNTAGTNNNPNGQPVNNQQNPNQPINNNPNQNIINNNANPNMNNQNMNNSNQPNNNYSQQNMQGAANFGGNLTQNNHTNNSKNGTNFAIGDNSPLGFPSAFNSPMKGASQAEDAFDEEDARNPIALGKIQDSTNLRESSIKREKFIKNNI